MSSKSSSLPGVYSATAKYPYHLSAGAVIRREDGQILCHYFKAVAAGTSPVLRDHDNVYILMRESVDSGESLEQAVHRGAMEEFGATIQINHVLSAQLDTIMPPLSKYPWHKTTVYFECTLIDLDLDKRAPEDPENISEVVWRTPEFLIKQMREQGQRTGREDLDESGVISLLST